VAHIDLQIKEARPGLHSVAPLTYSICWGYAATNVMLGMGLFFLYSTNVPIAVASLLSYQAWGIVFVTLGVLNAYGLIKNNWNLSRNMQMCGLGVKSVWAIALTIRCISAPQTIIITLIWLFFAYIQGATYVYFIPRKYRMGNDGNK
jgi:hypothetical protein